MTNSKLIQAYFRDHPNGQMLRVVGDDDVKCVYMYIDGRYMQIGTEQSIREMIDNEPEAMMYNGEQIHINGRT